MAQSGFLSLFLLQSREMLESERRANMSTSSNNNSNLRPAADTPLQG